MAHGDLVYFVVPTEDAERARRFYGELFGWRFRAGAVDGGFNVEGSTPPGGLYEGGTGEVPRVWFEVDDLDAALERVRELGGQAGEPEDIESGHMATCRDDQGNELNLWSPKSA
jgi:uncharacterized protein